MSSPTIPPTSGRPTPGKAGATAPRKPKKAFANSLVALSSAAVIAVYAAGYARTESAAGQMQAAAAIIPTATNGVTPTTAPTASTAPTSTAQPVPAAGNTSSAATGQRTGRQRPGEHEDEGEQRGQFGAFPAQPGASSAPVAPNVPAASSAPVASSAPIVSSAPTATATTSTSATTAAFKDGTYMGTGTSRHGSIGVTVTVQGGKLTSAEITDCGTRYPCSRIANLPAQALARQSAAVDLVSGATDSTNAYRAAVNAALAQAR